MVQGLIWVDLKTVIPVALSFVMDILADFKLQMNPPVI